MNSLLDLNNNFAVIFEAKLTIKYQVLFVVLVGATAWHRFAKNVPRFNDFALILKLMLRFIDFSGFWYSLFEKRGKTWKMVLKQLFTLFIVIYRPFPSPPRCPNTGVIGPIFARSPRVWHNELGSTMTIKSVDQNAGSFSGTYCSAVGEAKKEYVLSGRFDPCGDTLGWVVSWQNSWQSDPSTTAWCGHLKVLGTPQPVIFTTWLLTSSTTSKDSKDEDWQSTNVGFDTFTQYSATGEQILMAQNRRQCSHPKLAFKNKSWTVSTVKISYEIRNINYICFDTLIITHFLEVMLMHVKLIVFILE